LYKGKRILGLIPARGGSKGLPRKNILPLSGKPLIAWTIEQAVASKYLAKTIVSTPEIFE
jgi:CMP-N-acetylneuraminic acid synthetase